MKYLLKKDDGYHVKKFKELKAIPKVSLGQAVTEVSANDLAKVPRRHSNPFKPF